MIGPEGRPLEIQIRTPEMHELAEYGIAAHVIYKEGAKRRRRSRAGEDDLAPPAARDGEATQDPEEFLEALKVDLFEDEVFVFTPKGEVKNLSAGSTPLDFAYAVHTDVGHRCVGAKVNGKIVPLHYQLRSGDIVEILTAKQERGPSRDWLGLVRTSRARNKIRACSEARAARGRRAPRPRGAQARCESAACRTQQARRLAAARRRDPGDGLPQGGRLLHRAGPGEDRARRSSPTRCCSASSAGEAVGEERAGPRACSRARDDARRRTQDAISFGIKVKGVDDVVVRLAKCCRPVPGDEIVGYVSLGRGITIHREDCRNVAGAEEGPRAVHRRVSWDGDNEASYRVELQVDAWDRTRLLEDLSRTFAEAGINILEAKCTTKHPMVKNRFVVEVGRHRASSSSASRACATSSRCSTPTGSRRPAEQDQSFCARIALLGQGCSDAGHRGDGSG